MFRVIKVVANWCEWEDGYDYEEFVIGNFKYFGDAFKAMVYFTKDEEHMKYYSEMLKNSIEYGRTGRLSKKGNSDITYYIEKI